MNEQPALRKIETQSCTRCGGCGQYSYCQMYGSTCFKCHGTGVIYTKRGYAAKMFLEALRSKPASEVKVGELVQQDWGNPLGRQVRAFGRVVEVGWQQDSGGYIVNGELKKYWVIKLRHKALGEMSVHTFLDQVLRMGQSAEQKAETLKQALDYQDTLGKNGKVMKKFQPKQEVA